jgi:sulfide:quinone oxidoreductase
VARVLILGGGFGGLSAATTLRDLLAPGDEIVLVARDDRFAMGWTKLWDLTGIRPLADGQRSLHTLEERGIRYRQADISAIEPEARAAATTAGDVEADALIVALGAADHPDQVAQLDGDVAHNLYSFAALPAAKGALADFSAGRLLVAVMGQPFKCPPAPFEAILALDEHLRLRGDRDGTELEIATPSPSALPVAGDDASAVIADALSERDIGLRTEHTATRVDAAGRTVTFDTGEERDFALCFAVPGSVPPAVVAESRLAGSGGWIRPDPRTLRTSSPGVYAVGDCTTVPTATAALPKAGVFAAAEAEVAARNVAAELGHGSPATFDGRGHCYLEFPGRQVARVAGDFFAEPAPDVALEPPSTAAYEAKLAFERERLTAWFGG